VPEQTAVWLLVVVFLAVAGLAGYAVVALYRRRD
jgi:hypothetical protein